MNIIFTNGTDLFNDLFKSISLAKKYILIESYIFRDDCLGQQLKTLLIKKANENIKISIIYDQIGCLFTSSKFFTELKEHGVHVTHFFNPILSLIPDKLNHRNHQKIWIIDGDIAYIGGFNIGAEYLGKSTKFGNWRDTHIKLQGLPAQNIYNCVISDLTTLTSTTPNWLKTLSTSYSTSITNSQFEIIRNDPLNNNTDILDKFINIIENAKYQILIQTPYFIPDNRLISALKKACISGVDIRIMIPNGPDHPIVYWGTYYFVGKLLPYGIKFFTYEKGFLHSKTMVIDSTICSIGSSNLDMRSFNLNYEINTFIRSPYVISLLLDNFKKDIAHCLPLTLELYNQRSHIIKVKELIARLISFLL